MKTKILPLLALLLATPALAVPVPWLNCGAATDLVSFSEIDASVWPPGIFGPPFPLYVVANFNPSTGELVKLRASLIAPGWLFELKLPHGIHRHDGFVKLPQEWVADLSPEMPFSTTDFAGLPSGITWQTSLPVPAGPVNRSVTLPPFDPRGSSLTGVVKGVVGSPFQSPSRMSVAFNGVEGFPFPAVPGSYSMTLKNEQSATQGVFCIEETGDTPFVTVAAIPFKEFDSNDTKGGKQLVWSYGHPGDWFAFASEAMNPEILVRPCDSPGNPGALLDEKPQYDDMTRSWFVDLDEDDGSCVTVSIKSRLTEQVDGPFKVEF